MNLFLQKNKMNKKSYTKYYLKLTAIKIIKQYLSNILYIINKKLEFDTVIVDETSMCDMKIFSILMSALDPDKKTFACRR